MKVASLVDIAGMKMRVIQVRGSWKDYLDIHTLVAHGIDVPTGLAAAKAIDRNFDPITSIRALQFLWRWYAESSAGCRAKGPDSVGTSD